MDGGGGANHRSPMEVFRDFYGRRAAIIRALTTDASKFYATCDPEKENLCLYGYPDGNWEVNIPADEVPPEIPEPSLGINFARDGMVQKDWLSLVAVHSDSWLLSIAFYFAARFEFDKEGRRQLFDLINDVPTIFEEINDDFKKQPKERTPNRSSKTNKSNTKMQQRQSESRTRMPPPKEEEESGDEEEVEDDDEEHGNTLCGACGENYASDEFWICCDVCERWFHGKCVRITPARAEHIKQYKCPACSSKRVKVS